MPIPGTKQWDELILSLLQACEDHPRVAEINDSENATNIYCEHGSPYIFTVTFRNGATARVVAEYTPKKK